jgi:hypothetical protein
VRALLAVGGLAVVGLALANVRHAWLWLGLWVGVTAGFAFHFETVPWAVLGESFLWDIPWLAVVGVAAWMLVGASGMVRPSSFLGTVGTAALLGSMTAWVGAALAEPDEGRRARLVVAGTGAALITPWASPASWTIGVSGFEVALLGLGLALLGFTSGGKVVRVAPSWPEVARAALLLVWLVLLVWLLRQAGLPDFIATGLEGLEVRLPGRATLWLGTVASIVGSLFHPAGAALLAGVVFEHASQLRGVWAQEALRIGLTVGAGLPALLLTRAKFTVGFPLWMLQVFAAVGYLVWRHPG